MTPSIPIAANEPLQPVRAGTWKRRVASTDQLNVDEIFFDAGTETADHGHNLQQVAYKVSGRFEVTLDGSMSVLGPGDGYSIPANAPHRVRCIEKGSYVLVTAMAGKEAVGEHHDHDDHDHHRGHGDH